MNARPLFCTLLLVATAPAQALPAFPGAEGGGAESVGGRGGVICEVTNLNKTGPGSLQACISLNVPRIVVFRVSGTIELTGGMAITNPYITIAGQTAPGGGITISGKNSRFSLFSIRTHNIIIRYLRFRKGYNSATISQDGDSFSGIYDVATSIADHCSISWTQDENGSIWGNSSGPQPHDITFSWSIFAEPLGSHPTNFMTGSSGNASEYMTNVDVHHSFLANSSLRNPLIKNKTFRFVNNIVYNWARFATQLGGGVSADVVGNFYKAGPLNGTYSATIAPKSSVYEIQVFKNPNTETPLGSPSLYAAGNIGPHNLNSSNDNWAMVREVSSEGGSELGPLSTQYRRTAPLPALPIPITSHPADVLENVVLPTVGASQRLDCMGNWVSSRDAVDARIIQEYKDNKGIIPITENDVGGFPTIADGTPCADTDHDGMPDAWEDANGLNKNNPADGPAIHSSGYSNVERYLNGTPSSDPSLPIQVPTNLRILSY
jgi:pectate lyase